MRERETAGGRRPPSPERPEEAESPAAPRSLLALQTTAGNQATVSWVRGAEQRTRLVPVVQRLEPEWTDDTGDQGEAGEAQELQDRSRPRTKDQARAMVDGHVQPRSCFIEYEGSRAGWRAIPGTGCAHWVAHQRGGPTGTSNVCELGFKYRVTELLASLTQRSADLQSARVGDVWSASGSSHVGIIRAVTREDGGARVVSVSVENDSSASGGVVTQTKTDGSVYGGA
ncbi:hypothetical protein [Cellulomonas cellasea]|uniref:Uncharacterized protein n=2 Tax=Cellulomonas cellasea TaxID=43670 RepID=A0A0A0B6B0_9CELL|nr:hypothetical protein [Cellulomonas cellasea]KGM01717.1 hypothetical protein Q760_17900 [Cellulomonas cellasea DSM 20118]GEA87000.1 hypothetical protein CCE01nite_09490 [Cellulomonas cellasea]